MKTRILLVCAGAAWGLGVGPAAFAQSSGGFSGQGTWVRNGDSLVHSTTVTGSGGYSATGFNSYFIEDGVIGRNAIYSAPGGQQAQQNVVWVQQGDSIVRIGATTSGGSGVGSAQSFTKSGDTIYRQGYSQTAGGQSYHSSGAWTATENGAIVHYDTITRPDGSTIVVSETYQTGNGQIVKTGSVTGPNGGTAMRGASWTRNGDTVVRQGATIDSTGTRGITSQSGWTRTGNTISQQGYVQRTGGQMYQQSGTWTRTGGTVSHQWQAGGGERRTAHRSSR